MAKFNDLIPMLMSDDVPRSIDFYRDVLGFQVTDRMDDIGKTGFAFLRHGSIGLMLASPTYLPDPVKVEGRYQQSIYYFYPDDVVGLRESIQSRGWPVSDMRVSFYGMKEFDLLDPDGHVLWFGQETSEATTMSKKA